MRRGYIKLWRKSLDSGWLANPLLWCFWCWCLMKATHKPCKVLIGFQEVFLSPGQFVFGRKKCAKELKTSERSVRTCLQTLKSTNNLTIKVTNKFSIINIVNWTIYQEEENTNDQQDDQQYDQQLTSNRPTTDHIQTHKECRNTKRINNKGILIPDWLPTDKWQDFKDHRKALKKPLTPKAEQLAISKLDSLRISGNDPVEVINNSIMNGWQGLFELKDRNKECDGIRGKLLEIPPNERN